MNKVIYIVESRFTERDFHRFGVQSFLDKGVDVYVWDVTTVMNSKAAQAINKNIACNSINIEYFNNQQNVVKSILELDNNAFILSFIPYHLNSISIYRAISKKNIRYSLIRAYSNIFADTASSTRSFLSIVKKLISINVVMNKLLTRMPLYVFGVSPANYVFTGGLKSNINDILIATDTKVVPIHTLDYDEFLNERVEQCIDKKYIVFIDQNLPFHTDRIYSSQPAVVTPQVYYEELNEFFGYLEHEHKASVVIASHPRADLIKAKEFFLGREVIIQKTAVLIKNSLFAIIHYSNAVNYCVLYEKPFILITTDELNASGNGVFVSALEKRFVKKSSNVTSKEYLTKPLALNVDTNIYNSYARDFIKDNNNDIKFWDVVVKTIGI